MLSSRFTSLISRKSSLLLSSSSSASATTATSTTQTTAAIRHNLSKCWSPSRDLAVSSFSTFRPSRRPGKTYQSRHQPKPLKRTKPVKGPKEPNDVSRTISKIDFSKIDITDVDDEPLDDWSDLGPLMTAAIQKARHETAASASASGPLDVETQLKMMDYFISAPGSTEDLVGERRALSLESWDGQDRDAIEREIDRLIHQERIDYMELPELDVPTLAEMEQESGTGSNKVPTNQLAHGDWGEMLIRTDRVCKMWRGGRIESYRALVIGGNLRGCGGFGVGKAFEPEDAVEIASRMARRNIFFVDRYRNRSLTRDLMGRQNSCKVYLRATDNGLRGNPLCCEILKLMGITNVVAKAHGNRNHHNVVRATFKALQTHESLDEVAMKRGLRLVNLQKAKRLQI